MDNAVSKPVHAVALALVHRSGRWLVARRHEDTHLGGQWEFPGGKVGRGEDVRAAALRELHEECGVDADIETELAPLRCEYDDRVVDLHPFVCRWTAGEARAIASQECRWMTLGEIRRLDMPAINTEIIREIEQWA